MSKLFISKVPDRKILQVFDAISRLLPETRTNVNLFGVNRAITLAEAIELIAPKSGLMSVQSSTLSYSIENPSFKQFKIEFFRYRPAHSDGASEFSSPYFDLMVITQQGELVDNQLVQKIMTIIHKELAPIQGGLPKDNNILDLLNHSIKTTHDQLQDTVKQVTVGLLETRNQLDASYAERVAALELNQADIKAQLQKDYKSKIEELDQLKAALESEKRALDDRGNTHVRREIRRNLKDEIAKRGKHFSLTPQTKKLRFPIHIVCAVGLALIATLLFQVSSSTLALIQESPINYPAVTLSAAKQFGLTFALLGLLAYYIRWMNRWFDKHAETEFKLKQFDLDIDRASWVIESALEWRREGAGVIPSNLLDSMTRNLFAFAEDTKEEIHPADYLASALMGTAKSVRLGVGGAELELNGKDLRKAKLPPQSKGG